MNSIFKYTTYRPDFFDKFHFKLSRFGEFNDPFEMVMGNYFSSLRPGEAEEVMSFADSLADPAAYIDAVWDAQCGVRASAGVICFTKKPDNLLMWAHYANCHQGICIKFDSGAEHFKGKFKDSVVCTLTGARKKDHYENIGVLRRVEYKIERPSYIQPQELEGNTKSWFVKSPQWGYEEEYRMLVCLDSAISQDGSFFIEIKPPVIKSMILGCQMPPTKKEEIFNKCLELGILVKESFVHSHEFKLDIVDYAPENHSRYCSQYNLNRITKW